MVGRRGLLRLLLIGAVVAGIGAAIGSRPAFTASSAATLPACSAAQLTPRVGASMVNQGVGSYADPGNLLARGKDTEVRFFLVTSTDVGALCSGSISVRSANLTVTNTAGTSYATPALKTFGTSGTLIPSSILSVDSNADPKFVLPAANANSCVTTPCADTGGFRLAFTATISYTTSLQPTAPLTTTATTTAGFDRASN